jgi:hypothetical protein
MVFIRVGGWRELNIHLMIFVSSIHEPKKSAAMMKTFESSIRPVKGDILDDPGFHPDFHNGYEVVKVTLNYAVGECWVSLSPAAIEVQDIPIETYIENLEGHGWRAVAREE